ncbi:MAG: hypothetical protein CME87_02120 [Herbaspirillum sp.]|nr:hypothetical protein [Herbaspirillum sp.]
MHIGRLLQGLAQDALSFALQLFLLDAGRLCCAVEREGERAEQQRRKEAVAIHKEMVSEQNNTGHACRDHSTIWEIAISLFIVCT